MRKDVPNPLTSLIAERTVTLVNSGDLETVKQDIDQYETDSRQAWAERRFSPVVRRHRLLAEAVEHGALDGEFGVRSKEPVALRIDDDAPSPEPTETPPPPPSCPTDALTPPYESGIPFKEQWHDGGKSLTASVSNSFPDSGDLAVGAAVGRPFGEALNWEADNTFESSTLDGSSAGATLYEAMAVHSRFGGTITVRAGFVCKKPGAILFPAPTGHGLSDGLVGASAEARIAVYVVGDGVHTARQEIFYRLRSRSGVLESDWVKRAELSVSFNVRVRSTHQILIASGVDIAVFRAGEPGATDGTSPGGYAALAYQGRFDVDHDVWTDSSEMVHMPFVEVIRCQPPLPINPIRARYGGSPQVRAETHGPTT